MMTLALNGTGSVWLAFCSLLLDLGQWMPLAQVNVVEKILGMVSVGLQVAAGLGFVIFVHELGHFLAAKTFGVRCDKFYVGFDVPISIGPIRLPRTLGKFRWGETEYGIGIVPLGGYVKMLGQDDDPRNAEEENKKIRVGEGDDVQLDPRSYQAKPVWQRMIIISAGVVMNVIFAVFLAAAAFLFGVPYAPSIVGSAPLGTPAWQAGVKPGDQVLQIAKMTEDDPYLRFEDMAGKTIIHGMRHKDKEIPFTISRNGERSTVQITPSNKLTSIGFYLAGINSATVAKLSSQTPILSHSFLATQKVDLQPGDEIIAVNGTELPKSEAAGGVVLGASLTDAFQAYWNKTIELTVRRSAKDSSGSKAQENSTQEVKVTLPPTPTKTLGIGFAMGPIAAIQRDSVADKAGLKVGDVIVELDGQPVTDAMRFPMQVAERNGSPIELKVRRGNEDVKITLKSDNPVSFGSIGQSSAQWGITSYGLAFDVSPVVASVDPEFEKAVAGVQVGDELTQVKLELSDEQIEAMKSDGRTVPTTKAEVSPLQTIATHFESFQTLPVDAKVRCYMKRGSDIREVVLPLQYAKDWYWFQRGILMQPLEKIQKTSDATVALKWGAIETRRKLGEVFEFLTVLISGRASPRALGGPLRIANVAAMEASNSPSRLLLFLTMLSANLAILNFLPIPALDGGHLMFLTAEAIRGKPVNEALQIRLTMVSVMCLLGLMAFVLLNDIIGMVM